MGYPLHAMRDGGGFIHAGLAGEGLHQKKLIYLEENGRWKLATAKLIKKHKAVAITVDTIRATKLGRIVLPPCFVGSSDWNFPPDSVIYASNVPGELTLDPGDYAIVVGRSYEGDIIWFDPGLLGLTVVSKPPPGDNFKMLVNLYVEIVDGNPKLRFFWDDGEP